MNKRRASGIALQALALLCGLAVAFPALYGVLGAFKSAAEFSAYPPTLFPRNFLYLQNFADAFARMPFFRYMLNSLVTAGLGAAVRLLLAALAAYAFAFYRFKGQKVLFFLLLCTMMLPGDTLLTANYLTVTRLGLLDSYLGMTIVSFVGASAMFMLRQNFKTLPRALREAAALDGCGDLAFLALILMPLARPVLVTLFVQSFIAIWNAYLWPLLVTSKTSMRTIQVGITMLTSIEDTNYHLVLAGATLSLLPSLVLFYILRKNITRAMTAGSLVG